MSEKDKERKEIEFAIRVLKECKNYHASELMDLSYTLSAAVDFKIREIFDEASKNYPTISLNDDQITSFIVYWKWLNEMIQNLTASRDLWKTALSPSLIAEVEKAIKRSTDGAKA
jgi:nitrate/TMAO reductase-like tetraheme cytochrome c subunit